MPSCFGPAGLPNETAVFTRNGRLHYTGSVLQSHMRRVTRPLILFWNIEQGRGLSARSIPLLCKDGNFFRRGKSWEVERVYRRKPQTDAA